VAFIQQYVDKKEDRGSAGRHAAKIPRLGLDPGAGVELRNYSLCTLLNLPYAVQSISCEVAFIHIFF